MVQEVHIADPPADSLWRGATFFTPGDGRSGGCMILVKPNPVLTEWCEVPLTVDGAKGRVLRVDAKLAGEPVSLVCVYAPVNQAERRRFFQDTLPACLPPQGQRGLIMGGDWNCILSAADYTGADGHIGEQRANDVAAVSLRALLRGAPPDADADDGPPGPPWMADAWRLRHPDAQDATHFSAAHGSGSRLDTWFVSSGLAASVRTCDILDAAPVASDHLPVTLALKGRAPVPMGMGLSGIRPGFFDDAEAKQRVAEVVDRALEAFVARPADAGPRFCRSLYLNMKRDVLLVVRIVERERRRQRRTAQDQWAAAARVARAELLGAARAGQDAGTVHALHLVWTAASSRTTTDYLDRAMRRMTTLDLLSHTADNKPTFFFHRKARPPHPPVVVRSLKADDGAVLDLATADGTMAALNAFAAHYSADSAQGVFAARDCDAQARQRLLAAITTRLSPAEARLAEGPHGDGRIVAAEVKAALATADWDTSPGQDGLTVEFYAHFWQAMARLLIAAVNEAFDDVASDAPLADFLQGILTLIPKLGKPADEKGGYRPITLLDIDTRLVAKVVANRLQVPLEIIISPTQTAFINGRDIADNVQYHLGLVDYLRERRTDLWLLLMDLQGAYDNVDWGLLRDTMLAMGFKAEGHVRWAMILHRGATGRIKMNGFLSDTFPVRSGLLQGSGASPVYWTIALQPLTAYLDSLAAGGRIRTAAVPLSVCSMADVREQPAPPSMAYADDINASVADEDSAAAVGEAFDSFKAAGGPVRSAPKCVAMRLGQAAEEEDDPPDRGPLGMAVAGPTTITRHLGVPLSPGLPYADLAAHAFSSKANAMRHATGPWRGRGLPLEGRVHVTAQCLASKVIFQMAAHCPPGKELTAMEEQLRLFVAASSDPLDAQPTARSLFPNQYVSALRKDEGGLGFPLLRTFAAAMSAKLVVQAFGPTARVWQPVVRHLLRDRESGAPPTWVVTAPSAVKLPPSMARLQAHVDAFAKLRVRRVVQRGTQSFYSVMAEPLHHNDAIAFPPGLPLQHVFVGNPERTWWHLRDVYDALHHRRDDDGPPTLATTLALQLVLAAVCPEWRAHLNTYPPPAPIWECALLQGAGGGTRPAYLIRRRDNPATLWWGSTAGRLVAFADDTAPVAGVDTSQDVLQGLAWEPAAVVESSVRMHRGITATRPAPPVPDPLIAVEADGALLVHCLLGPWRTLLLDMSVWGWMDGDRPVTLLDFTVKAARIRLVQQEVVSKVAMPSMGKVIYSPGAGVWPRLWGTRPVTPEGNAEIAYDATGVTELEQSWRRTFDERRQQAQAAGHVEGGGEGALQPGERDAAIGPAWLDLARPRPARPAPEDRREAQLHRQHASQPRQPVAQPPEDDGGGGPGPAQAPAAGAAVPRHVRCRAVWRRVHNSTDIAHHKTVAWRVLHGTLPVGAFRLRVGGTGVPLAMACCPGCAAAGRPDELETLTHAFMTCPIVAPAWAWLRAVYGALAGEAPPDDPLVLLADAYWRWRPPVPALWQRLRVAFLGCAWAVRCINPGADAAGPAAQARALVLDVLACVIAGLRRDWRRVEEDVVQEAVGMVPTVWFRGVQARLTKEQFLAKWPCAGDWYHVAHDPPGIMPRLTTTWPVDLAGFVE